MRKVIIDGYNLIFQFPELRRILERDLEGAREGLLNRLGLYAGERRIQIVVVFDGDDRMVAEPEMRPYVKVLYSQPPEKADPMIKRMIEKTQGGDIVIVSSDHEIVNYARLYGAKVVSSRQFAHELLEKPGNEAEKKFDHPMSQEELDEWLNIFRQDEHPEENN